MGYVEMDDLNHIDIKGKQDDYVCYEIINHSAV